jgi:rhomboid protease GluP
MLEFIFSPIGILIFLNVFIYFLPNFYHFGKKSFSSREEFLTLGWKNNSDIKSGEYYRLVTAMFLHVDGFHLFSNMWALFVLGAGLNGFPLLFLGVYFLGGIVGNLFSFFFNKNPSVGASSPIMGLVGFILIISLISGDYASLVNLGLYTIVGFVLAGMPGSRIDFYGHLGGLAGGGAIALCLSPFLFN